MTNAPSARLAAVRQLLLAAGMPNIARDLHSVIADVCRMERTLDELVAEAVEEERLQSRAAPLRRERRAAEVLPFRRPVPVLVVGEDGA